MGSAASLSALTADQIADHFDQAAGPPPHDQAAMSFTRMAARARERGLDGVAALELLQNPDILRANIELASGDADSTEAAAGPFATVDELKLHLTAQGVPVTSWGRACANPKDCEDLFEEIQDGETILTAKDCRRLVRVCRVK